MIRRNLFWISLGVLLVFAGGCGGSSKRAAVAGNASLDGKPIEGGTISFIPIDRAAPPGWGQIEGGHFSISAGDGPAVGRNRVEIYWNRKTGKKIPARPPAPAGMMIEEAAQAVPSRYNSDSELQVEVNRGENTFTFSLHSH